jgi:cytochrome b6-f complex iron-sulfur subunit
MLNGCQETDADSAPSSLTVPLAMLPPGQRTNLELDGHPIELLRTENGVTARSLRCTHQGCEVKWEEDAQQYVCPCHEGKFDAHGKVIYGMPTRPLATLAVSIQGDQVIVKR